MKEISIRELHRRSGAWARDARKCGSILIRDRSTPVAKLIPVSGEPAVNLFEGWKPQGGSRGLSRGRRAERPSRRFIGQDRNR
jgi:antitoxin (DNA-binding transcriptional repressor) of toxin-antitoxin stability system